MQAAFLTPADNDTLIHADVAVVGGGPVGLVLADRCARAGLDVLVLESGLAEQDEAHEALNHVDLDDAGARAGLAELRTAFHAAQVPLWNAQRQAYGVRCRGLGGSTQGWAGKSAPFDPIDFAARTWVPDSGWPIGLDQLAPHIDAAGALLGLCPYPPSSRYRRSGLNSFYWQFARSRGAGMDLMRFGRDFAPAMPENVRVLMDASVTGLELDRDKGRVSQIQVASLSGARVQVAARHVVLAAGAIENARLLLASDGWAPGDTGNPFDNLGRYLIDHAGITLGSAAPRDVDRLARRFGFYAVQHAGRSHMFQHGLALDPAVQENDQLLNAAIYFAPQRAPDNPWDALSRLLHGSSDARWADLATCLRGSGLLVRGASARMLASPHFPRWLRERIVEAAIRLAPNAVAEEFSSGGLPHKLSAMHIEAISETAPLRSNRITLSEQVDVLGVPLPRAHWNIGAAERRSFRALAERLQLGFADTGLAPPQLEAWISAPDMAMPPAIDLAHSMGTTRMAADPRSGVVDRDCKAFGIDNLYCAGGSVFPTGGHANPTWMYLALALRLSDHLVARARHA